MNHAFVCTTEAAKHCQVAESTVRSWVRKGWLPVLGYTGGPPWGGPRKAWYRYEDVLAAERRARRGAPLAS